MLPLLTKWLESILGNKRQIGLYLADDAIALSGLDQSGGEVAQTGISDMAASLKDMLQKSTRSEQPVFATVALTSREFDTYILNFTELPDKPTAREALVRWTLQQRGLMQKTGEDNGAHLRYQVMGKTPKGIKVLVEVISAQQHDHINHMLREAGVSLESLCRASHHVFNDIIQSKEHEAPAALLFLEPGMVSAYFWNEDGILTYCRNYTSQPSSAMGQSEVAADVISIIRRLEHTEWSSHLNNIYIASSRFYSESTNTLVTCLAEHCEVQLVGNDKHNMAWLVNRANT